MRHSGYGERSILGLFRLVELICCVGFGFEGAFFRFLLLVGLNCKREGIGFTNGLRSLKNINGIVENLRWRILILIGGTGWVISLDGPYSLTKDPDSVV